MGEKAVSIGPAPAYVVAPKAGMLVFHASENTYVCPGSIVYTACTKAAFGEYVPANPPDSFQR